MKLKPVRLGLDVDGVMYQQVRALRSYLVNRYGYVPAELPDASIWNYFNDWAREPGSQEPMPASEWMQHMVDSVVDGQLFWQGEAHGDMIDAVHYTAHSCRRAGIELEIVVVTNRHLKGVEDVCENATRQWLGRYFSGGVISDIVFSADKTVIEADVFVEDNLLNYATLRAAGTRALLYAQPWNHSIRGLREFAETYPHALREGLVGGVIDPADVLDPVTAIPSGCLWVAVSEAAGVAV